MKRRILIIRLGSLGDIILTSPVIINLKIEYPDSHISFLCKERYREAAELLPGVDQVITISDDISARQYIGALLKIDRENFHLVFDLHGNMRSWLARKAIVSDQTFVYPKRRYERMVAVKRKVIPRVWPHTIDLYNETALESGAKPVCRRPVLNIPDGALQGPARDFADRNKDYVVVAPGAAHPNKQWPMQRFAEVANTLYERDNVSIVWAVTGSDAEGAIPERVPGESLLCVADYPMTALAALISSALLTVANDSGIAHASTATGTPVVALFGPTHPCLGFAPKGLFDRVIEVDEFCRPCSLHGKKPCYRDSRYCFDRIEPETVSDAASAVIEFRRSSSPAVFVDRDGTIIVEKNFLADPDGIQFEAGSVEALRMFKDRGFKIVVVSNQSGVARGHYGIETVERVNRRLMELLAAEGIEVDAVYYCPHHVKGTRREFAVSCQCRKPAAGMAETAAYQLNLNLRKSYVIGDKIDDVNFARVIGARSVMVSTGYGQTDSEILKTGIFYDGVTVTPNLLEAANRICGGDDYD